MKLTNLQLLVFWGWRRLVLPDEIDRLQNLRILNLVNNSIDYIPNTLSEIPGLQGLFLSGNLIDQESLPWSIDELNDHTLAPGHTYIDLAGNPICQRNESSMSPVSSGSKNVNYADTKACNAVHCTILCPDPLRAAKRCLRPCNTAACDWHDGNCLEFEELGRDALLYYNETHPSDMTYSPND